MDKGSLTLEEYRVVLAYRRKTDVEFWGEANPVERSGFTLAQRGVTVQRHPAIKKPGSYFVCSRCPNVTRKLVEGLCRHCREGIDAKPA